jgi:hypothetical protein
MSPVLRTREVPTQDIVARTSPTPEAWPLLEHPRMNFYARSSSPKYKRAVSSVVVALGVGLLACGSQPAGAEGPERSSEDRRFCPSWGCEGPLLTCSLTFYDFGTLTMTSSASIAYTMTGGGGGGGGGGNDWAPVVSPAWAGQPGATVTGTLTANAGDALSVYVGGGGGGGGFVVNVEGGGGGAGYYGGGGGGDQSNGGGGGSSAIVGPSGLLAYASGGDGGYVRKNEVGGGGSSVGGAAGASMPGFPATPATSGGLYVGGNGGFVTIAVDVGTAGLGGDAMVGGAGGINRGGGGGGFGSGGGAGAGSTLIDFPDTTAMGGSGGSYHAAGGSSTTGSGGAASDPGALPGAGGGGSLYGASGGNAGLVTLTWQAHSCPAPVCASNEVLVNGVCTPCPSDDVVIDGVCTPVT